MKSKLFKIVAVLVAMLALSACELTLSVDGKEVGSLDPCKVTGVTSELCAEAAVTETADDGAVVPEDEVTPEATETEVTEATATPMPASADTNRGYRIDFIERSAGRQISAETLVVGPALVQDRDGNVTVIMKHAEASFPSGTVWLYTIGDGNSLEDEILFLTKQTEYFNDPAPIWIQPESTTP